MLSHHRRRCSGLVVNGPRDGCPVPVVRSSLPPLRCEHPQRVIRIALALALAHLNVFVFTAIAAVLFSIRLAARLFFPLPLPLPFPFPLSLSLSLPFLAHARYAPSSPSRASLSLSPSVCSCEISSLTRTLPALAILRPQCCIRRLPSYPSQPRRRHPPCAPSAACGSASRGATRSGIYSGDSANKHAIFGGDFLSVDNLSLGRWPPRPLGPPLPSSPSSDDNPNPSPLPGPCDPPLDEPPPVTLHVPIFISAPLLLHIAPFLPLILARLATRAAPIIPLSLLRRVPAQAAAGSSAHATAH
ncbi:hypothetical protein EW145_g8460, partial [Phellinidium pouzarii]